MRLFFLLGADDPEMVGIVALLVKSKQTFAYATYQGSRVNPGNAYEAEEIDVPVGATLVYVECARKAHSLETKVIVVDHHRKGDPGFGFPPENFWEASSIGQIYSLLKLGQPTKEHIILAATDHCMVAARQGKCPGVLPEEVKTLRMKNTAHAHGVDVAHVAGVVFLMQRQLKVAQTLMMCDQEVVDLRGVQIGIGYSLEYFSVQEALADLNLVALLLTKHRVDSLERIIICGAASPETIAYFIAIWAPKQGLTSIYGVPSRGYAGGYKPKS